MKAGVRIAQLRAKVHATMGLLIEGRLRDAHAHTSRRR